MSEYVTRSPAAVRRVPAPSAVRQPRRRWWIPATILLLQGVAFVLLQYAGDIIEAFRNSFTVLSGMVTALLLVLWLVFFAGLSWPWRLVVLAVAVAAPVACYFLLTIAGWTGGMRPSITWAWTPKPDTLLPAAVPEAATPLELEAGPNDFPQFLGRDRLGVVRGVRLETDWNARPPREVWRTKVGAGWGGFAVVGPLAVTQEQRGDDELIVARDRDTGKIVWSHANKVRFSEKMGGDGPRATPTVTDGRVYALGATGVLDCLDAASGKLRWTQDTLKRADTENLEWGKSSSPLVVDDLVVVTLGKSAEGERQLSLAAYDKETGEPKWRAGSDKASYCSPALLSLGGERQLVIVNAQSVSGHRVADGTELWHYDWPTELYHASQPLPVGDDRLLLTTGYGATTVLLAVKRDGGRWEAEEVWSNRNLKALFNTPVARDGMVYGLDDGVLVCLDPQTGERRWKKGRYGHGQVLLVGETLLVQAEEGSVVLVEATPEGHRELARLPALSGKTWNNPALSGARLFLRNDVEAVCYELPLRPR
jgi:outer membrane protein assembly factor BamB